MADPRAAFVTKHRQLALDVDNLTSSGAALVQVLTSTVSPATARR